MARLLRSTTPVAAWMWTIDHDRPDKSFWIGLGLARSVSRILRDAGLLYVESVDVEWLEYGKGYIPITSRVRGAAELDREVLFQRIMDSHPMGYPEAIPDTIVFSGPGYWIDVEGEECREPDLIKISCLASDTSAMVSAMVYHDIWSINDFHGDSHPEIYRNNSPRLAASLQYVEKVLGVLAVPEDPTYFGVAFNYGVESPNEDVGGLDVTDEL